jgi:hypothetical protein
MRLAPAPVGRHEYVPMKVKALIAIALLLMIAWVVLRVALAITSGLLHLLWIVALVMLVIWAWGQIRAKF